MANVDLKCVLLLEDEPFIAMDLEHMLTEAGAATVWTFATCEEAEIWLKTNSPDLAIVDPNLKDGFCAAAVVALVARKVPFVVYSGDAASASDREPAFRAGLWLSKPCLPEALFAAINESLAAAG